MLESLNVPVQLPSDRLYLARALDWFHTGQEDAEGFDWLAERIKPGHPLRKALADGVVAAWCFQEDGQQVPIPSYHWSGQELWAWAYNRVLMKIDCGGRTANGYVIVSRSDFVHQFFPSNAIATGNHAELLNIKKLPTYVRYMIEIIDRFDLTPDYNFKRENLRRWIERNPPEGVPKISNAMSRYLATFVGEASHEGGGNKKIASSRSADPLAPHNDITYPKPKAKR